MKRIKKHCKVYFLAITIVMFGKSYLDADATTTAAVVEQTIFQKAQAELVSYQAVQTLLQVKANYDQAKEYYDWMKQVQEGHPGGLTGYFKDQISSGITEQFARDMEALKNYDTGKTNYVRDAKGYVDQQESELQQKLAADQAKSRAKMNAANLRKSLLDEILEKSAEDKITEAEANEIMRKELLINIMIQEQMLSELQSINNRMQTQETDDLAARASLASYLQKQQEFLTQMEKTRDEQNKGIGNKALQIISAPTGIREKEF
jgi:hypothetical protein